MLIKESNSIIVDNQTIYSAFLERDVLIDIYIPALLNESAELQLLFINDGQDLQTMHFNELFEKQYEQNSLSPLICIGIHCSADRKNEYGTANALHHEGYGAKASLYNRFILEELIPFVDKKFSFKKKYKKSFAGFSLGGLSALDIVWNHPEIFSTAGVFSGALWWRDRAQDDPAFNEETDRIMHRQIREGKFYPALKFFFETGTLDETADRNNNGIIDSIDDTLSLIEELAKKGYDKNVAIKYLELQDGRHDISTWAKAFPYFLQWGWGISKK